MLQLFDFRLNPSQHNPGYEITEALPVENEVSEDLDYIMTSCCFFFTYKRDAGSQQQDPDQEIFKLLNHQLPDGLAWERRLADKCVW